MILPFQNSVSNDLFRSTRGTYCLRLELLLVQRFQHPNLPLHQILYRPPPSINLEQIFLVRMCLAFENYSRPIS